MQAATQGIKQVFNVIKMVVTFAKRAIGFATTVARLMLTIFWFVPLLVVRALAGKDFAEGMRNVVLPSIGNSKGEDS